MDRFLIAVVNGAGIMVLTQSFVLGLPTNVQFMGKDSKKIRQDGRLGIRSLR
jgi:hypothetical protein